MTDHTLDWTAVREADLLAAGAVVAGFRRRRRRAAAGAALGLSVAAVMSSSALLPASTSSLTPADTVPTTAPRPVPSAAPARADGPRAAAPSASPDPGAPGPGSRVRALPSAAPPPAPAPPSPRAARVRAAMSGRPSDDPACGTEVVVVAPQHCTTSWGAAQGDGTYALVYQVCYLAPAGDKQVWSRDISFATTREVDFAIRGADRTVLWQWSTGQRFVTKRRVLTLRGGECYEWRTTWDGRLDDGARLAPGNYTLRGAGRDDTKVLKGVYSALTVR